MNQADEKHFVKVNCTSWQEFKNMMSGMLSETGSMRIYRGQADVSWPLKTSLERVCERFDVVSTFSRTHIEQTLLSEFKKSAPNFLGGTIIPETDYEWYSLMQHYGAPTRFLDFTHSPYVAAFFGCSEAYEREHKEFAVWAIDVGWLQRCLLSLMVSEHQEQVADYFYIDHGTSKSLDTEKYLESVTQRRQKIIIPITPPKRNRRLMIQQGIFLIPGDIEEQFMANIPKLDSNDGVKPVMKVVVQMNEKGTIMQDLLAMNISAATLYGDLDGFSRSLKFIPLHLYRRTYGGYFDELFEEELKKIETIEAPNDE